MSRETLETLNTNTLIGNTDARGTAWHYRAEHQGEEANHYSGPIPVEDVRRRLFSWEAVSRPVAVEQVADLDSMTHINEYGIPSRWEAVHEKQAICRSDTGAVMGIFGTGYTMHQYDAWLLTTVADILDEDLSVSSAGLLRGGAVAWVEVSVPESIRTPEGVVFRPNLLATTSFDGSVATTFKRTVTDVVCDNTREAALAEHGQAYKVKHSRHSHAQLAPAREALAMIHSIADDFAREVATMCATAVSDAQWNAFLDAYVPRLDRATGTPLKGRSLTIADRKRDALKRLYRSDERVAPWAGTAHGVVQAVNTWEHHESTVRGTARPERNMLRTVTGDFGRLDRNTMKVLHAVLA
jgi:phage/plasmid-like protein (TIGR03299 family)